MPQYDVDITNCDQEPIHQIGEVQSYGTLVAADTADLIIRHVAQNTEAILGLAPDQLLGSPLGDLVDADQLRLLRQESDGADAADLTAIRSVTIAKTGDEPQRFECVAHTHADMVIVEFVPQQQPVSYSQKTDEIRRKLVYELTKPATTEELANLGTQLGRMITGYDRVMVYKFHDDGHGHVLAENTDRPDRFLNLHYPASDIPEPARRHFMLNRVRVIADVESDAQPILPAQHPIREEPLDLTFAKLRAVSPMHIRYLKNMGVQASLSISIIANNQLWGLIACHHYEPRRLSLPDLHLCELLGSLLGSLVQGMENAEMLQQGIAAERWALDIEKGVFKGQPLASVVDACATSLMELIEVDGLVLCCDGQTVSYGEVPDVIPQIDSLGRRTVEGIWTTDQLSDAIDLSDDQIQLFAGGAFLSLHENNSEFLFLGRKNYIHTVDWAGDPNKNVSDSSTGSGALGPRQSFELWREEVSGKSKPFPPATLEVLRIVRRGLFLLRSVEREHQALEAKAAAEADQAQLKIQLLDATRTRSLGELANTMAHELNQPLAALVNYVNACRQELSQLDQEIPDDVLELMDESVAEADRAGTLVRRLRRFIEQGELEQSALDLNDVVEKAISLALSMSHASDVTLRNGLSDRIPQIWGDRLQIEQVIFNLVRNSAEAMHSSETKVLSVSSQKKDNHVEVSFRDTGPGIPSDILENLFEPLQSTKPTGMGIGLSLCRSIIRAHGGSMNARNVEGGAEFTFTLPCTQQDPQP